MQPRDVMDEADPYDFGLDGGEADHDDFAGGSKSEIGPPEPNDATTMLNLDIQARGLSKEHILKYSVCKRLYPSSNNDVPIYFRHLSAMGLTA